MALQSPQLDFIPKTLEAIEKHLNYGFCPQTPNRDALVALGFERAYPDVASGYKSTLWHRFVDMGVNSRTGVRKRIEQKAILLPR